MILGAVLLLGLTVIGGLILTLFPSVSLPDGLTGAMENFTSLLGNVSGIGAWFPFELAFICMGVLLAVWLAGFGAKLVRVILSHIPGVGGKG